ncbi:MAG: zinc-ribbon domain-containing protein [Clostridia bacterium]|nr:zinc-ribbon domain-containing protein [Clostridia bacterium]
MFCQNCGKPLADGAAFCGYCGCACTIQQPQKTESTIQLINTVPQSFNTGEHTTVISQPAFTPTSPVVSPATPKEKDNSFENIKLKITDYFKSLKTNKKRLTIFASSAALIVILIACAIIIPLIAPPNIIGTWLLSGGVTPISYGFFPDGSGKEYIQLGKNEFTTRDFTWKIDGDTISFNYPKSEDSSKSYKYEIDNGALYLIDTTDEDTDLPYPFFYSCYFISHNPNPGYEELERLAYENGYKPMALRVIWIIKNREN